MTSSLDRHVKRIQTAIGSSDAANLSLVASWRRSSSHKLDPADYRPPRRVSDVELNHSAEEIHSLIAIAQPILNRLFLAVGGAGCSVVLANRHGLTVDRRGAQADDNVFRKWGLWVGADWSEESEGTNGIGTCIVEQRTLTIHRDQHFLARNGLMSCTTAPIFDHDGELAAVVDVSSCRTDLAQHFLGIISIAVSEAARRIEFENFKKSFPEARIICAGGSGSPPNSLLAIDPNNIVVGATRAARQTLGIPQGAEGLTSLTKALNANCQSFQQAERQVIERTLVTCEGNISSASKCLGISRATLHRKINRQKLTRSH